MADTTGAARIVVPLREVVQEGHAARVLIDAAQNAQLLVIGNRGHAVFTEALLGSAGQYSVHHSPCPVVIVRGQGDKPRS